MSDRQSVKKAVFHILRGWRDAGVTEVPKLTKTPQLPSSHQNQQSALHRGAMVDDLRESMQNTNAATEHISERSKKEGVASKSTTTLSGSAVDRPSKTSAHPAPSHQGSFFDDSPLLPAASALPVLSSEERLEELGKLAADVARCVKCEELACTRTQTVFGVGNITPRLCFFGEAPGADEDRQGEPFVGAAGQLLNKIIEACTLKREDVYILNVLKCRPPGNRNPTPEEAANCRPFFERQLEILHPEFICCLGRVAAQILLDTTRSVGKLRGKFHDYHGDYHRAKVMVTYHPAYLLRNPSAKRETWEDMKMLLREMGIEVPSKNR